MYRHPLFCFLGLLIAIFLAGPHAASPTQDQPGGKPPAAPALSTVQKERLKERDRYAQEARKAQDAGNLAGAVTAAEKQLAIEREVLGETEEAVAQTLAYLADLHKMREDFAGARQRGQELLALRLQQHGEGHWQWTDARLALAYLERLQRLGPAERCQALEADRLNQQAEALRLQGKTREALKPARRVVELRRQILGEAAPEYAQAIHNLGRLHLILDENDHAEPFVRQAVEARKKVLGEIHPDHAASVNNLGNLTKARGDLATAERLYERACDIWKKAVGEEHPYLVTGLFNLARVAQSKGDHTRAEKLWRQILDIQRKAAGEASPAYALALNNLGFIYAGRGESATGEEYYRRALEIYKKAFGEEHPDSAWTMHYLGTLYMRRSEFARAEPLLQQAVKVRKKLLGEANPDYVDSLEYLAMAHIGRMEHAKAEPLLREAAEFYRKNGSERQPRYGVVLSKLALVYVMGNDPVRAEPLIRQALKIEKETAKGGAAGSNFNLTVLTLVCEKLADSHLKKEDFESARKARQEVVELKTRLLGGAHWKVMDTRLAVAHVERLARMDKAGRQQLAEASELIRKARELRRNRQYEEAVKLARQAVDVRHRLLGPDAPEYANALNTLALTFEEKKEYATAEPLYREMVSVRRKVLGEMHPDLAQGLHNLASLYDDMDQYDRAELLYLEALEIRKQTLGEEHEDYATTLYYLSLLYEHRGDLARALPPLRRALEIRRKVLGEEHEDYARSLNQLGRLYLMRGNYTRAEQPLRRALEIRRKVLGEGHEDYANTLRTLGMVCQEKTRFAEAELYFLAARECYRKISGEEHSNYADIVHFLGDLHYKKGDVDRAEQLFRRSLELRRRLLGEGHPDHAASLNSLGTLLFFSKGDHAKAEPLLLRAAEILRQTRGSAHPDYATCLNNIGELYRQLGDYAQAESWLRQALAIRQQTPGEDHPDTAVSLYGLGSLFLTRGDYVRAEPYLVQAAELFKKVLKEEHPHSALSLNALGLLYTATGDYARAERALRRALELRVRVHGTAHVAYAESLLNLAMLHQYQRDPDRAAPLLGQAVAVFQKVQGEGHPNCAMALNNLGVLYWHRGDERAEPLLRKALDTFKKSQGELHSHYAISLLNLGGLHYTRGDHAQAELLMRQACQVFEKALGKRHPFYVTGQIQRAFVAHARQDSIQVDLLCREAVDLCKENLDLVAAVQSERQQLAMLAAQRLSLDVYLTLTAGSQAADSSLYAHALTWKGAVFSRQRHLRELWQLLQDQKDPEVIRLSIELEKASNRLGALTFAVPAASKQDAWQRQLEELTEQKERLEKELVRRSGEFRRQREAARTTPADLQSVLPKDAALVDFLEYTRYSLPKGKSRLTEERHLVAFVVRPGRPVFQLELGPVEPVAKAVEEWRAAAGRRGDPGNELRRLLWRPLEPHLQEIKTLLISPDGALARLPFAALPGREPDTYLLEELAVAVVPVPHLLPGQLGRAAAKEKSAELEPSLLLVGDVDFGGALGAADGEGAGRAVFRGAGGDALPKFRRLESTLGEILVVRRFFERRYPRARVQTLEGAEATEQAFRRLAPGHRWLHLATHGFFAPPNVRSALAPEPRGPGPAGGVLPTSFSRHDVGGFHPGLLSGLVFAGANRTPTLDAADGILTALEVGELDLRGVELAGLSACETGLGEAAGGEGLLGLQRAFQVAGARSVVASLWQVQDDATRKLMERFYENLWLKKLPRLVALREAQLWMLREGAKRGFGRADHPADQKRRLPPYYWAGFVLSGDWR